MNSIKLDNFKFFTDSPWNEGKVFRALIPSSAKNSEELHKFYASLLRIGGYYGHNWDALDEVIKDLEWIEEREVEILHDGLPGLSSEELKTYLNILSDAVDFFNDFAFLFKLLIFEVSVTPRLQLQICASYYLTLNESCVRQ